MIVRCVEKPHSRRKFRDGEETGYEYILTLVSNSASDNEATVEAYPGVPRYGAPYGLGNAGDGRALCNRIEIARAGRLLWEVTCRYSDKVMPLPNPKPPQDPLQSPVQIVWSSKEIEVYDFADVGRCYATGGLVYKPYVNSFGDPLEKVPGRIVTHAIVTLVRNEASYDPVRMMQFAGKVNVVTWFACPPRTALCHFPGARMVWDERGQRYYWEVTYSFEIAPETWDAKIIDAGKRYRESFTPGNNDPGPFTRIVVPRDDYGVPTGMSVWLNGDGAKLSDDLVKKGEPYYLLFRPYVPVDFNNLIRGPG